MASFQLRYEYKAGDKIDIWGHTTDDYDPESDYYVEEHFIANTAGAESYEFTYNPQLGYKASIYINDSLYVSETKAPDPGTDPEPDVPKEPKFELTSILSTIVTASVTNIKQASVTLQILNADGVAVSSKTMDFGNSDYKTISISVSVSDLTPNTLYKAQVLVDSVPIGTEEFRTTPKILYSVDEGYTSVNIYLDYVSGCSVSGVLTHNGDIFFGTVTFLGDGRCRISFMSLSPGVTGTVDIVVENETSKATKQITIATMSYPTFQWTTTIEQGAEMGSYNNNPAPVTASDWNRLISYIKIKFGVEISTVQPGDELNLYVGGNVYNVAKVLGVTVTPKTTVTAEFFNKLKDAYNSN